MGTLPIFIWFGTLSDQSCWQHIDAAIHSELRQIVFVFSSVCALESDVLSNERCFTLVEPGVCDVASTLDIKIRITYVSNSDARRILSLLIVWSIIEVDCLNLSAT